MKKEVDMETIQKIGRDWLYAKIPPHHRFAIASCAPHGDHVVMNNLRNLGYNWNTAKQLLLAYQEQQQTQDKAGEE